MREADGDLSSVGGRRELLKLDVPVGQQAEDERFPRNAHLHLELRLDHRHHRPAADVQRHLRRRLHHQCRHLFDRVACDSVDSTNDVALHKRALSVHRPIRRHRADCHFASPPIDRDTQRAARRVSLDSDLEELLLRYSRLRLDLVRPCAEPFFEANCPLRRGEGCVQTACLTRGLDRGRLVSVADTAVADGLAHALAIGVLLGRRHALRPRAHLREASRARFLLVIHRPVLVLLAQAVEALLLSVALRILRCFRLGDPSLLRGGCTHCLLRIGLRLLHLGRHRRLLFRPLALRFLGLHLCQFDLLSLALLLLLLSHLLFRRAARLLLRLFPRALLRFFLEARLPCLCPDVVLAARLDCAEAVLLHHRRILLLEELLSRGPTQYLRANQLGRALLPLRLGDLLNQERHHNAHVHRDQVFKEATAPRLQK
mmetsp:Transcript_16537/g.34926  ORF Transcript_16537/g.34926 Transcript_16537/m.34926 type:complete len:429 (+) Transcript_16537:2511-3797(+)